TFYRIRVGMFADTNAAKKYGADLVRRGVTADFFVAPFEQPLEEKTVAIKPISKPTPASAPVNTPATTATLDNTTLASSPPKQTSPETAINTPPKDTPDSVASSVPPTTTAAPTITPAGTTTPAGSAAYARYQDPAVGYSFEYPSYWTGQPLDPKDA